MSGRSTYELKRPRQLIELTTRRFPRQADIAEDVVTEIALCLSPPAAFAPRSEHFPAPSRYAGVIVTGTRRGNNHSHSPTAIIQIVAIRSR